MLHSPNATEPIFKDNVNYNILKIKKKNKVHAHSIDLVF